MRGWVSVVAALLIVGISSAGVNGQGFVPGGLTALPGDAGLGASIVQDGGFEMPNGSLPAGWTGNGSWGLDQTVVHSGGFSYRHDSGAPTASQTLTLGPGTYTLSGWVKTAGLGDANSGVRLTLDLRPGGLNAWYPTAIISGTQDWTYYEVKNIVVSDTRAAAVLLETYGSPSGTAWFDDVNVQQQLPQPLSVFMLYPNYRGMLFDDQSQAMTFDVTVIPPGNDFGRYKVRGWVQAEGSGVAITAQDYPASGHFVAQLDGSGMQPGTAYLAVFALVDQSSGASVYNFPAFRVSKQSGATRAAMNISFDAQNHILVHGVPRFVLGVYDSGLSYSSDPAYWENTLWSASGDRRMNGLRINFYLNYWYGGAPAQQMDVLMANLQSHGVMYLQTGNCFDTYAAGGFAIDTSDPYVQDVGSQSASAGYYTADECVSTLNPGVFAQYQRLKQLDPDSMTLATLLSGTDLPLWRDSADVMATDPYPMYGGEPAGGYPHSRVADWTSAAGQAVMHARPYLTVLQFFQFTSAGRFPTLSEMRSHAYMAIVEGAQGLFWWSLGSNALADVCPGWCDAKTGYMSNLKAVVSELADLEPVLLADDASSALTGNSNPGAIRTKVKVVNGTGYIFAYNYTNAPTSTTFWWNTDPGTVAVNAEGRTVPTSGNSFSDSFGPYQAHVYVLGNGGAVAGGGAAATIGGVSPATSLGGFVANLYADVLSRTPAASEVAGWMGAVAGGSPAPVRAMVHAFFDGPEYESRPMTPTSYVTSLYNAILGRTPSAQEASGWVSATVAAYDNLVPGFLTSAEFQALRAQLSPSDFVTRLYQQVLGRTPTPEEMAGWTNYLATTGDANGVALGFLNSAEYLGTPRARDESVAVLYRALLGRQPAPSEVAGWAAYLTSELAVLEDGFLLSPEFQARFNGLNH